MPAIEAFWVKRIVTRFENEPFTIRRDAGASIQSIVADIFRQALERQRSSAGMMVVGTVMQHMVGAKLEAALSGKIKVAHHGANTTDKKGRGGDFDLGDSAIHVTAAPSELLIKKCEKNLANGLRPIIITVEKGVAAASFHADQAGLASRIDIHAIDQFLATNIVELGLFDSTLVLASFRNVIERYNRIVAENEANPSLRIEWS